MPQKLAKCSLPPQTHHGSMLVWCLAHLALCNLGLEIILACLMQEGHTAMTPLPARLCPPSAGAPELFCVNDQHDIYSKRLVE